MEAHVCLECGKPADWVRSTQFAGDHPFCDEHARKEPDFEKDGDSYFYWYEVAKD
jgi:endogenous inhibitor of DNA gyrase (YacG/DUF329 family)